jgi:hypothetical protein
MIRSGLIVLVSAAVLAAPAAHAQNAPDNEDSRYSFHRVDDGYLRLDGRSGQVSICGRRPSGWQCQAVPDERAALEAEIARLQGDNVNLKKELLARNLPLPGGAKVVDPPSRRGEPALNLPSDAELDQIMTFMGKVWKRMVEMIVAAQKDMAKEP